MICKNCTKAKHSLCDQKQKVGVRCDCPSCKEVFLKSLTIDDVEIVKDRRCLKIKVGNWTNFIDVRDLYNSPNWNEREDNRLESLYNLRNDKDD